MNRKVLALASSAALLLAGCASTATTASQDLEKADTVFLDAYAATNVILNSVEKADPAAATQAEAIRAEANKALADEQVAYKSGQSVAAMIGTIQALETQAQALK